VTESAIAFVVAALAAFGLGVRGSLRLTLRYRAVKDELEWYERLILWAIVVVAWTVTVAAGFYAATSGRRLLGYEPLEWTPLAGILIAIIVMLIPTFLDAVVERVARVPWRHE
jgi:hypothetical protein